MEEYNGFEALKQGLEEALAYKRGERSRCRVVVRELPVPEYKAEDVVRTRKALNLSQRGLASALGVSSRTVESWEAGVKIPSGPARHLLFLLENDNALIDRLVKRQTI